VHKADNITAIYELIVYSSDGQLAARSLIYSGPRQVTGLVRLVKGSLSS
jgi:hypothetical protein